MTAPAEERDAPAEAYAEGGDVCIGFLECRCARCLVCPNQQAAKRRAAEIRKCNWTTVRAPYRSAR